MALNKKQIFQLDDTRYKLIKVKAWNNSKIKIKTMSAAEKIDFIKLVEKDKSEMGMVIQLVVSCCVDDNNNNLFTKEDIPALKSKSADALIEIASECLKLSEIGADAVEDAAKN